MSTITVPDVYLQMRRWTVPHAVLAGDADLWNGVKSQLLSTY